MHIDQNGLGIAAQGGVRAQHLIDRREGIVEGTFHEDIAQHLRHQDLPPACILEDARARARRALGEVQRAMMRFSCSQKVSISR